MTDTISGFTHLNGSPVQARVSLIDVASNSIVGTTLSDAGTGAWAFSGLPAGRYEVVQMVEGYKARVDGPWVLSGALWGPDKLASPPLVWLDDESELTASGGRASQWRDRTVNNWQFAQSSLSFQPSVLSEELNGRRALRFDGSDDFLSCSIPQMQRAAATGWALTVYRKRSSDSSGTARVLLYCPTADNASRFNLQTGGPSANAPSLNVRRRDNDSTGALDSSSARVGEWLLRLDVMEWSTGTGRILLNGAQVAEKAGLTSAGVTDNTEPHRYGTAIGATGMGSNPGDVDVAAVVVGSGTSLSADEVDKLFGWAAHRYGLSGSLPPEHPFKNAPPLVEWS